MATMVKPELIQSIDQLHEHFDLFLFDQYGVLHDGRSCYPGMLDCLSRIKAQGKSIGVITNSGKRAYYNAERLAGFGFGADLVDKVISSGEVAWTQMRKQIATGAQVASPEHSVQAKLASRGRIGAHRVLYLGQGEDRSAINGLPLLETYSSNDADVILITGSDPQHYSLDDYEALLSSPAQRGVPAYCTNPDRWSLLGSRRFFGPGQIASRYESLGGSVIWIGKPFSAIYEFVMSVFQVPANRILCIGDSIEHDIRGAALAGCASLLTATGVHAGHTQRELQDYYLCHDAVPTFLLWREELEQ